MFSSNWMPYSQKGNRPPLLGLSFYPMFQSASSSSFEMRASFDFILGKNVPTVLVLVSVLSVLL